ncbi:hypothetical protein GH714_028883 [Hevea brasiliensis]|uniref:Alpha-carbonic anhydrase domain-containing protein n=1 Tax=Hevea brasiliensis TaxID=3981 RepID=A0A6A6M179_HEVBR|nr:hypothetical protein GH714_028883 [Hevea brasiliensis]
MRGSSITLEGVRKDQNTGESLRKNGLLAGQDLQSPIDMSNNRVEVIRKSGDFKRNYKPCNSVVKNRGHDISLLSDIKSMNDQKQERTMGMVDPREIKMGDKRYYRYLGSLTVPPCTERVIWTINKKIRTVSEDQVKALREAVHDYAERNARPVQPLNKREIKLYEAEDTSN